MTSASSQPYQQQLILALGEVARRRCDWVAPLRPADVGKSRVTTVMSGTVRGVSYEQVVALRSSGGWSAPLGWLIVTEDLRAYFMDNSKVSSDDRTNGVGLLDPSHAAFSFLGQWREDGPLPE